NLISSIQLSVATRGLGIAILCIALFGCKSDVAGPGTNTDLFTSVTVAITTSATFSPPSSSVPDAANQFIYFVAGGPNGPGVFKVPSAGGTATEVFVGAPFSAPVDLALSTDNQTIFVSDSNAGGT